MDKMHFTFSDTIAGYVTASGGAPEGTFSLKTSDGRREASRGPASKEGSVVRREDVFISLSAELTGYSPVQLIGTGMCDQYLAELGRVLPAGMVDGFLSAHPRPSADGEWSVLEILQDATWGPVARRVMILWYCGSWTALPDAWHAVHGVSPADTDHVVSAEAYQAGLQWVAAGAHPAGARQQGFGAWAQAPAEILS